MFLCTYMFGFGIQWGVVDDVGGSVLEYKEVPLG